MDKLHRLHQKNISVEEYRQKMELYMMMTGIREEELVIVTRLMSDLSLEIRDKVKLISYRDLNDLFMLCLKIE